MSELKKKSAQRYTEAVQNDLNVVPFKVEQFKTLILNTYDEFFGTKVIRWKMQEFLDVVRKSFLE